MQAIILAGGFGTRLKSAIGEDIPKPMAPIAGEPFLAHYLRYLQGQGITHALLSLHHLAPVIRSYFGDAFEGMPITYTEESTPLGTGGAIRLALDALQPEKPVYVSNGDTFVEADIPAMLKEHEEKQAKVTVALRNMPDCSRYGEIGCTPDGRIVSFCYPGGAGEGFISTGCYIISPDAFAGLSLPEVFSFEVDYQRPYADVIPMYGYEVKGYFIDIGIPSDYARAEAELKPFIKKNAA